MALVKVTPKPDVRVRHPDTGQVIGPAGETVEMSSYWRRREKAGDVTLDYVGPASSRPIEQSGRLEAGPAPRKKS
jgi:hypothetical protein